MRKPPRLKMLQPRLKVADLSIAKPAPKVGDPFYKSKPWRDLLTEIITERGRRCEDPLCDVHGGRTEGQIYGDHKRELKDGGAPLDKRNVLLSAHHVMARRRPSSVSAGRPGRWGLSFEGVGVFDL